MIENGVASEYTFREATKEERQGIADYIDSISVDTGINLWNLQEQVKIYDAYRNKGYESGIEAETQRIKSLIEEVRSYKFGICDADFVLDVLFSKLNGR